MGWEKNLPWLLYNSNEFHTQRKLFQQTFTRQGVLMFQPVQTKHTDVLLKNLLRDPDNFTSHVRLWVPTVVVCFCGRCVTQLCFYRFTTAITMEITYGYHAESSEDKYVVMMDKLNGMLDTLGRATTLTILPWSKW